MSVSMCMPYPLPLRRHDASGKHSGMTTPERLSVYPACQASTIVRVALPGGRQLHLVCCANR
jgi:hypothetical protein